MNNICGNISEVLDNPLQYKYLFLNDKGLESLPPSLSAYKNCLKILAPNNQLTEIPEEIGELSKLEMLHLDSNHLSALPASLVNCANLHLLYLDNLQILGFETIDEIEGLECPIGLSSSLYKK